MKISKLTFAKIQFLFLISLPCMAQVNLGSYKGCSATDADFKKTKIWEGVQGAQFDGNRANATKVAFVANPDGLSDVYITVKTGKVIRYNSLTKTLDELGTIPEVDSRDENGLIGIAIRNDFKQNPYIYFTYSYLDAAKKLGVRIVRIKLSSDLKTLDLSSQKVLITFARDLVPHHTGGAMDFDAYGDLWITVGDHQTTTLGPGNTADLRGGVLRIHPDDSPKGYSIPSGNFGEYFSNYFKSLGKTGLANNYLDTNKVKPQIYIKGLRNPYTLSLDPVRRWMVVGDVGPDGKKLSEKYVLTTSASYLGWPYFSGKADFIGAGPYEIPIPSGSTRAIPINKDTILGVDTLPPVTEAVFVKDQSCAMTGPIMRYDGSLKNPGQMPPQLNRKWLIQGCDWFGWWLFNIDSTAHSAKDSVQIFGQWGHSDNLIDLKQAPDGSLYQVEWGNNQGFGNVTRIDYTGSCKDPSLLPEKTGCAVTGDPNFNANIPAAYNDPRLCGKATGIPYENVKNIPGIKINTQSNSITISMSALGYHRLQLIDIKGKIVWETNASGPMTHLVSAHLHPSLYWLKSESGFGKATMSVSFMGF